MPTQLWRQRITSDPQLVSVIVASLADMSIEDLLREFPQLALEDIQAALFYAAEAAHNTLVA